MRFARVAPCPSSPQCCPVSHDPTAAGFDALSSPPQEGEPTVKWPILAQLPWVGEPLAGREAPPRPTAIPFAAPTVDSYPQPLASEPPIASPPLRLAEPRSDFVDEEYPAVEPPHLNLHRFTPAEPLRAVVEEPEYRATRSAPAAPARQYRRIDPPQHRAAVSLHAPAESLASRIYQWHAAARPQLGVIALAGLLLAGGGLYWAAFGRSSSRPAENAIESAPWTIELTPRPSTGGSVVAPAPASSALPIPPLDLTPNSNAGDSRASSAAQGAPPTAADLAMADDPIAAWLNSQPLMTPRIETPTVVVEPIAAAPTAAASPQPPVPQTPPVAPVVSDPTPAPMLAPTPATPNLSLTSVYPTTPFPPFNFSLSQPPTPANAPSVAETWGMPFDPPSMPR